MDLEELRRYLSKTIDDINEKGGANSIDDLNKMLGEKMTTINSRPVADFEGLSPDKMHQLLHFPLGEASPIRLKLLSAEQYHQIPLFNQVLWLLREIEGAGGIKLTQAGYLPVRVVKDLYAQGFITDNYVELGHQKLNKEMDSRSVHMTRILVELSGLVRKQHGKLVLVKSKMNIVNNNKALFDVIFHTFTEKFSWAYLDMYHSEQFAQFGWGFSVFLLSKFGDVERDAAFYAKKYIKAFPMLINDFGGVYMSPEEMAVHAYTYRTFELFLNYFGLVELRPHGGTSFLPETYFVKKTPLVEMITESRERGAGSGEREERGSRER